MFQNSLVFASLAIAMHSLFAITLHRFWAVFYPISYRRKTKLTTVTIIIVCWLLGIVLGFLQTWWNSGNSLGGCKIRVIMDFNYLLLFCVDGIMLTTFAVIVNCLIYRKLCEQVRSLIKSMSSFNHSFFNQAQKRRNMMQNDHEEQNKIRAFKTLAMVTASFIIFWLPGVISFLIMAVTNNRNFPIIIFKISNSLIVFNSFIDPIIYAFRMKKIRDELKKVCSCCSKLKEPSEIFEIEKICEKNIWT